MPDSPRCSEPTPSRPVRAPRAALYARVSTLRHGQDVGLQLDELRQVAAQRGYTISAEYIDEGVSGSKASRPALNRLMADVQAGRVDILLVWKLDRLGRIATLYGKDLDLVLVRAGYKMEVPQDLRDAVVCDDAFAVLMLHPQLRPACMDERWLEAFSRVQKAQIIDFARKLDQGARAGSLPTIDELIRDDDDAQAEEE